jgi:hypothetical protein
MLTKTDALKLVLKELHRKFSSEIPVVVIDEYTIEKPYGWVFFYNSRKFLETDAFQDCLLGNGPIIINKNSGTIEFHGSGTPLEEIIGDYEKRLAND